MFWGGMVLQFAVWSTLMLLDCFCIYVIGFTFSWQTLLQPDAVKRFSEMFFNTSELLLSCQPATLASFILGLKRPQRAKQNLAPEPFTYPQVKVKEGAERSGLEKIQKALMDGKPARSVDLANHEKEAIQHLCLLTMKPVIYVANVTESDLAEPDSNPHVKDVTKLASDLQSGMVTISAQVEAELAELPLEERVEYLKSIGVTESGLGNW